MWDIIILPVIFVSSLVIKYNTNLLGIKLRLIVITENWRKIRNCRYSTNDGWNSFLFILSKSLFNSVWEICLAWSVENRLQHMRCVTAHAHLHMHIKQATLHTPHMIKMSFRYLCMAHLNGKSFPILTLQKLSKQNAVFNFKLEKMVENSIKMIQYLTFFLECNATIFWFTYIIKQDY